MKDPHDSGYEKDFGEVARRYIIDMCSEAFVYLKDCEDALGNSKALKDGVSG